MESCTQRTGSFTNAIWSSVSGSPPYASRTLSGDSGPGVCSTLPLLRAQSMPAMTRSRCEAFIASRPVPPSGGTTAASRTTCRTWVPSSVAMPGAKMPPEECATSTTSPTPAARTSAAADRTQSSTVSSMGSAGLPARPGRSTASDGRSRCGRSTSQNAPDIPPPWTSTNVISSVAGIPGSSREETGRSAEPSGRAGHGLDLEVLLEALHARLPPDAALAVTAERHVGAVPHASVERDRAGADAARDLERAVVGRAEHRARQPVLAVVGDRDRVVDVVVGEDHEHRPEDLLTCDLGRVVDADEQRRLDVPPLRLCLGPPAAGDDRRDRKSTRLNSSH